MILPKISAEEYIDEYKIKISFNDGLTEIVDLKEKVYTDHRSVFKPLQEIDFFKDFKKNKWTIEWKNGVDMAAEFLYEIIGKNKDAQILL